MLLEHFIGSQVDEYIGRANKDIDKVGDNGNVIVINRVLICQSDCTINSFEEAIETENDRNP